MKTLKITTQEPLTTKEQGYLPMEMDTGAAIYRGKIKIRGNSTADGFKKPYAIKLETKAHLLGRSDNKYILLANCYDPTMMRNKLAFKMAEEMGVPFTPEFKYVGVYLNNEYKGMYLLTDSVIDKIKFGFVIEAEQWDNPDTSVKYVVSRGGRKYKIHFDDGSSDIAEMLNAVEESDNPPIDMYSFATYYVLQEFFKNADVGVSSTVFSGGRDELIACCPWDFDLSSGNYKEDMYPDLYIDGDSALGLFATKMYPEKLFTLPVFKSEIVDAYEMITPWIEKKLPKLIDKIVSKHAEDYANDVINQKQSYCQYQIQPLGSIEKNAQFLKDWFMRRHEYLKEALHP